MHNMRYFIFFIMTASGCLTKPCSQDFKVTPPLNPLIPALYKNLKQGLKTSKKPNKIIPRITSISYGSFFNKCSCEIDLFRQQSLILGHEHIGRISFTCKLTSKPKVRSVYVSYITTKTNCQHKGLGKLLMHETLHAIQRLAQKTGTSFIFYLLSSEVTAPQKWVGYTSLSSTEQRLIRNKFYTKLGLTESESGLGWWDYYLSYKIFGEPSHFGMYFYSDPTHMLPEEFKCYKFGTTPLSPSSKLTPSLDELQDTEPHIKKFFKNLELYLYPFFSTKDPELETLLYPHIVEKFSFKRISQKSFLKSADYTITTSRPLESQKTVLLLKAARASSKAPWKIEQSGLNLDGSDLWLKILQKVFVSAFSINK